uniref:Uncharacterized protein n=1 Tax=Romanomermis culicivorax TaxID=13658 RepID=A0A915HG44_ROMCU
MNQREKREQFIVVVADLAAHNTCRGVSESTVALPMEAGMNVHKIRCIGACAHTFRKCETIYYTEKSLGRQCKKFSHYDDERLKHAELYKNYAEDHGYLK